MNRQQTLIRLQGNRCVVMLISRPVVLNWSNLRTHVSFSHDSNLHVLLNNELTKNCYNCG